MDDIPGEDISGKSPILVSADNVSPFTRAYLPQGMYDKFKVYAVSEKGGNKTVVMNGYNVVFANGDWTYVNDSQPLMYWSSNAERYLFTAGAPIRAVTAISGNSMTLHLENNTTGSAMAAEPLKIEYGSADYGKIVNLRFGYAHCRVCVAFTRNATDDIAITDIKLTPQAAITSKADLVYSFNWSDTPATSTTEVTSKEKSSDTFTFADVTIPSNSENAVVSGTRYYCVPDASNAKGWTVSLKCNGEEKTGLFENTYTWQSGKNYIYVFSLAEKSPKLIKVITQDDLFDCNDIVPGGEFSDTDMIE
ncbi:MAG: fimbrillin family protein [Prevotella sp.]